MQKRLIPIYLLTFVNTIGFSILFPVLPFIVEQYGQGALAYGVIISAYSLSQFLASPVIGSFSDKYGRRPTLLVSQFGTFLSWLIFGLAYFISDGITAGGVALPLIIILLSRIIDGITGGNVSVTNAYVADITKPEDRTKIFGYVGAVTGLGFMVGPALGGFSASFEIGYLGLVLVAGAISFVTLIMTYTNLTESLTEKNRASELDINIWNEINLWSKMKKFAAKNMQIRSLFIRKVFFSFAFACFTSTFALYGKDILLLDAKELGFIMLFIGIFAVLNQSVVVQRVAKRFGDAKTFDIGQIILAISIAMLALAPPNLIAFFAIMYFTNLGMTLSMPTFRSMLTGSVSPSQQGQISGIDEAITAGNNGLAPVMAGALYGFISVWAFGIFASILLIPYALVIIFCRHGDSK